INTQGQSPHAVPVIPVGGPVEQLALSSAFMCALLQSGAVRCWGRFGGYGYGNLDNIGDQPGEMPPPDIDLGGTVLGLSSGSAHTCARMAGGSVRCWGANSWGELGLGHTNTIGDQPGEMPPPIVDLGGPVAQLSLASQGACALMETGTVRCWGRYGMFSYGNNLDLGNEPGEMPPPDVDLGPGTIVKLEVGSLHACVLLDTGAVRCWGYGNWGLLGNGSTQSIGDQPGEMPPPDLELGG